jgi:hypothetical protein
MYLYVEGKGYGTAKVTKIIRERGKVKLHVTVRVRDSARVQGMSLG